MEIMVNIPDKLYQDVKKINKDIETSIIHALELYSEQKKVIRDDPFFKWLHTPFHDKEGKTDISENHDKYIYTNDK